MSGTRLAKRRLRRRRRTARSFRPIDRYSAASLCFILVVVSFLVVGGCHRPLRPVFERPAPPITWPADPAQARIRYVGNLTSSADLKPPRKPFQGMVDLLVGPKAPEQLYGPRAVVTTSNGTRVWVADPGGRCLHLFDLEDRSYRKFVRMGDERLFSPSGLCVGPGETILVCDSEAVAIYQLAERTGALVRVLRLTDDVKRPVAVHYAPDREELFVVDVAGHGIKVLSPDGRLQRILGRRGSRPGEFNFPCDIAAAADILWIADTGNQRIQGITSAGDPVVAFGEAGDTPGRMAMPKGVATDREGNVYVVDARFENVQIFDRAGKLLLVIGEEGNGPGQFWLPAGVFIDQNDRIWICDSYNRRVQVFERVETAPAAETSTAGE